MGKIRVLVCMRKFKGGPRIFRERLVQAMSKYDEVEIIHDEHQKFDVELVFLRKLIHHDKPKIIRVDGCYYEYGRLHQNDEIIKSINEANCIIYQSEFSKKMCESILKVDKKNYIVHNGISFDSISSIDPKKNIPPNSFIACSEWRKNKRPSSTVLGFLRAKTGCQLYMVGEGKIPHEYRNSPNIHLLGSMQFNELISLYKACRYQLHLTYIDSCPNAVVEGLVCGLDVLCTNLGGTREIMRENGVVMDVDKFGFELSDKKDVDTINPDVTAAHIHKLMKLKTSPDRSYLDINNVAKKYVEIIKENL